VLQFPVEGEPPNRLSEYPSKRALICADWQKTPMVGIVHDVHAHAGHGYAHKCPQRSKRYDRMPAEATISKHKWQAGMRTVRNDRLETTLGWRASTSLFL
jgi:hypothetical protein